MADDLSALENKLIGFAQDLSGSAMREVLKAIGQGAEQDVADAVIHDLGDQSMSGWRSTRNGSPIPLGGHSSIDSDKAVTVSAAAVGAVFWKKGAGPMRVLESGRKAYRVGDRRVKGQRTRKKDGVVVQTTRKIKRNIGATRGKNTWTEAVVLVRRNAAKSGEKALATFLHHRLF